MGRGQAAIGRLLRQLPGAGTRLPGAGTDHSGPQRPAIKQAHGCQPAGTDSDMVSERYEERPERETGERPPVSRQVAGAAQRTARCGVP